MFKASVEISGLQEAATGIAQETRIRANIAGERLFHELYKEVEINLSDNVLRIRTGRLIGSMEETSYVEFLKDAVQIQVGVDTPYAAYQEFGFSGSQQVSSFTREVSSKFGSVLPAPISEVVNAFTRNVRYKGRPYVRPALAEIEHNVVPVLTVEINK